ncbi:MAG: exo-alpha-sialidase [Bacteroidetes bacterium]|nr:exo-alpha-sialidase [Bacteroidota bacterium]MBS1931117.1 exo-alpha-sialidase [Bacteroidota bacterium]
MAIKKILLFFAAVYSVLVSLAQTKPASVFISGDEGYKSFRIPSIIKASNGDLLAFCEGRVNGAGDFGHVNIVMKRSTDNGKTWSKLQIVAENGDLQAGNAAPVVDQTDPGYPNGRIFLFYNTGNNHEGEVRKGNGLREVWYKTSSDNGNTWSNAVNITLQVHRPRQPQINPAYNFPDDWRSFANTPGHAMQFHNGKYKGRIFVAANHSAGTPQPHFTDYLANGFYTDDHGKTFHISDDVNMPGGNEATAAELSNGRLMMNIRNQKGDIKARIVAISNDGGSKWDTVYFDKRLPDPVCEGSILSLGIKNGKMILAFCNAADTSSRNNLTLRISYTEGKTWKMNILIDKNPQPYENKNKDYTAYSDLVRLNKNTVGVLYERSNYAEIVFVAINWKKATFR